MRLLAYICGAGGCSLPFRMMRVVPHLERITGLNCLNCAMQCDAHCHILDTHTHTQRLLPVSPPVQTLNVQMSPHLTRHVEKSATCFCTASNPECPPAGSGYYCFQLQTARWPRCDKPASPADLRGERHSAQRAELLNYSRKHIPTPPLCVVGAVAATELQTPRGSGRREEAPAASSPERPTCS
ncbi:hypothetical protein K461DRAFT_267162 [Myriangium duriaei CBS 260.36]|uniref:Uncharacterized protein n=1 Tax=Myriangium duriaei CBS 260.36 TaxID=1168546 RepID=A0A9P4J849_9PEZI|nr:hypothetical protein K461DRAFT_267162 [Myriangium duriaei CBS 260.36]